MAYVAVITAACSSDVWTKHPAFLQNVKNLIDGLNVDYKFKIFSEGAQKSSYDSDDLLTISRKYTAGFKITVVLESMDTIQLFEKNLAGECAKVTSDYYLRVRTRTKLAE